MSNFGKRFINFYWEWNVYGGAHSIFLQFSTSQIYITVNAKFYDTLIFNIIITFRHSTSY